MRKSVLRASSALQALAIIGGGTVGAFIAATPAAAQDYTSGVLTGSVTNASGSPVGGALVTIRSITQGTTQSATTAPNGTFSFAQLPQGDYDVTVTAAGNRPFRATAVNVVAGRTVTIPVSLAAETAAAGGRSEIVVVGRRIQAFAGTTTGVNVDVSQLQKTIPVRQSVTDIVMLAPGTTKGDTQFGVYSSRYTNLPSVNGGSVAENAYYINGLNITNFDNYLGSAEIPFYFLKTVEVKSGGYPAEFGRATGGVINTVSKAGTNEWLGAVHLDWAPDFLRWNDKDLLTCDDTGCQPYTNRRVDKSDYVSLTGELGGPIIRDRLFVYGLYQMQRTNTLDVRPLSGLAYHRKNTSPFWAVKADAYPLKSQHLELTIFNTRNTIRRENLAYTQDAQGHSFGSAQAIQDYNFGGVNYVGKYTGHFGNFLTLSGAYGRLRDRYDVQGIDQGSGSPYVLNNSGGTLGGVANGQLFTGQTTSLAEFPYATERKFYRADADIIVNLLGNHHFRFGFDREDNTLNHATVRTGGPTLCPGFLSTAACGLANGGGASIIYQPNNQVEINYLVSGGGFTARNQAYYAEDEWKPTDRLTVSLGIRRDDFRLNKQDGSVFLESKGNYQPRVGATYQLWNDKSGSVKAFFGRYYMPFASNTAARQASAETYFSERWLYSSIGAGGIPVLTTQTTTTGFNAACPFGLTAMSSGQNCQVNGSGETPDTSQATSQGLRATRETEILLGYQQKWRGWNFGVDATYRKLDWTSEDSAIDAAVRAYCTANGIAGCNSVWSGYHQYVINNPGYPITVVLNAVRGSHVVPSLIGKTVTLDPKDLGYPKAKRTYKAIDFTWDRPFDGVWGLSGSYTLSFSKGNTEGGVQSDYGQNDTGITIDFDQPGFVDYSNGYLPNDRRHRFKLWGSYAPIKNLILGTQVQIQSPRHLSCFGFNPNPDALENGYGPVSHYCNLQPAPRGTAMTTDWYKEIDFSARYDIPMGNTGTMLTLRADVFNVFNWHSVMQRYETGDLGYDPDENGDYFITHDPNFGTATLYQAPRSIRLGLDIAFGGHVAPPPPPPVMAPPPPPPPAPPATQTCPDGSVILATAACPAPPPPPPPPAPAPERGH